MTVQLGGQGHELVYRDNSHAWEWMMLWSHVDICDSSENEGRKLGDEHVRLLLIVKWFLFKDEGNYVFGRWGRIGKEGRTGCG
jgi:hypothetical protein